MIVTDEPCCSAPSLCVYTQTYQCGCLQCQPHSDIRCYNCNYIVIDDRDEEFPDKVKGLPTWFTVDNAYWDNEDEGEEL